MFVSALCVVSVSYEIPFRTFGDAAMSFKGGCPCMMNHRMDS